ncbi:MAG: hypothetical protein Kow0047_32830 [Anaerolineae bacterium]
MEVIENPTHPYVQLLIDSIPVPDPTEKWGKSTVVSIDDEEFRASAQSGCRFYPRCPHRMERCLVQRPPMYNVGGQNGTHEVACYLYE